MHGVERSIDEPTELSRVGSAGKNMRGHAWTILRLAEDLRIRGFSAPGELSLLGRLCRSRKTQHRDGGSTAGFQVSTVKECLVWRLKKVSMTQDQIPGKLLHSARESRVGGREWSLWFCRRMSVV